MRLIPDDALAIVTIFQEAEGESMDGKTAVGEVIRRRMALRYSSDGTLAGTVLRKFQFSGWNTDSVNRIRSIQADTGNPNVNDCAVAWEASRTSSLVPDAVLYYNPAIVTPPPAWATEDKFVGTIGAHSFYRA